jgi:type I restriction enzyme S subunit
MNQTYQINHSSDNLRSRVFILQKSELEKRLDPQFYKQEYKDNLEKIKRINHKHLGEIVKFSSETWNQKDFFENTFPYIEISEIDTVSGEIQNIVQVEKEKAASRAKMIVRENDIIISTTRPNRGAISLIKKEQDFSIASTGFSVIRNITNSEIDREYLFAILRQQIILKQFEQRSSGGNYPAITQEELSSITIALPEREVQKKIVQVFNGCFAQKQKNEAEVEKLLSSIDDYMLKELGIKLPQPPENTLKNRMFTVSLNELSGCRFDPHFHQEKFKQLDKNLQKGKFPISNLKKQSVLITSGATPLSKGDAYTEDKSIGVPFIRSGEIGNIDFDDCIYIKPDIHNKMLKSSQLKNGDLLIAIVGATIGEVGIYNYDREGNINQAIALVRLNDEVLPVFAKDFFKSSIGGFILDRAKRPVARANINLDEIGILPIPVPPLDKQKEIADYITTIRQQAQQLKDKTKEALKKASEEIEKILLG